MNIEATIERFIVDELMMGNDETRLDPDQSLINSGILDSLALLRLVGFIEEQFGVIIDDGEVISDNFESINLLKELLARKLNSN